MNLKHVGRIIATGRKCIVAYRTLPGDAYNCLIVTTENLSDSYHDALINLVESSAGQEAYEFAEAMARAQFPDGSTMLPSLHTKGKLIKMPTDAISMDPNMNVSIVLSELNQIIAEQRGVAVDDLCIKPDTEQQKPVKTEPKIVTEPAKEVIIKEVVTTIDSVVESVKDLSNEEKIEKYRSEANRLARDSAKFRRMADSLDKKDKEPRTVGAEPG